MTKSSLTDFELKGDTPAIQEYLDAASKVTFDNPAPIRSAEVLRTYFGIGSKPSEEQLALARLRFGAVPLKDKRTLTRCQQLIETVEADPKATYSREHLDALCGWPNKLVNKALRRCFSLLPVPEDRRNGVGKLYAANMLAIADLKVLLVTS